MNCNRCGMPIIHGASGYAGPMCMCQWRASDFSVHVHIKQDELERISHEAGKLLDEAIQKSKHSDAR